MNCRICKEPVVEIGTLGQIAISDFTEQPEPGDKYELDLVYCQKCTLLQLGHLAPREKLYKHYWYRSALNPVIVENLKEIAAEVKGSTHIDIGGNDGTLLTHSTAPNKWCVDPSDIQPGKFNWIHAYWEDYDGSLMADTITAIAMLYDLPDPNKFIINIKNHLNPDGVFIAQLMTLHPMIENNDVGNICHEHIEFYSYKSLVTLFEQNGLEIFDVKKNDINGGSYRVYARHLKFGSIPFEEKRYTVEELKAFFSRMETNKQKMVEFLKDHDVYGYGASTKMNTILQYYGVSLPGVVDVNKDKFGKFTIATGVPIIDKVPECDYLWVFPYGFVDYFKKREIEFKGKWITSIPDFAIL
jgi:SAM-dependent methyltransferase